MQIREITKDSPQKKLRVGAYCRVSTDHDDQEGSLENQMQTYEDEIRSDPGYEFVEVFYDFAISGYKDKRPGFLRMMQAARDGKVDLIITKSISRFARNTQIVLAATRELKELGVAVFFELQNINTLTDEGELMMTIIAAFAQAESEGISTTAKMAYRRMYEAGIPIQYLERSFGYMKGADGNYAIDPNEAKWVRKIYHMIADGHTPASVKRYLNDNGVKTTAGTAWLDSTVIRLVENEIYKGDYIMHKRFVDEDRKLKKNRGEVDSWYVENDHVAIVSRQLWQKSQDAIKRRRDYLSEGSVVKEMTDENYPYKNLLFCSYCGHPLYPRIYSDGNRLGWGCSGTKRYGKKFCKGINIPDSIIRGWGLDDKAYVYSKSEDKGLPEFSYHHEDYWKRSHKKKTAKVDVPALTKKNYPYMEHIFCGKCGSKLTRHYNTNSGKVTWICNGYKHKGRSYCPGIRIPDDEIRGWMPILVDITISEGKDENGKKCHSYSCQRQENDK